MSGPDRTGGRIGSVQASSPVICPVLAELVEELVQFKLPLRLYVRSWQNWWKNWFSSSFLSSYMSGPDRTGGRIGSVQTSSQGTTNFAIITGEPCMTRAPRGILRHCGKQNNKVRSTCKSTPGEPISEAVKGVWSWRVVGTYPIADQDIERYRAD